MLPHEMLAARKGQSRLGYYRRSACLVPAILAVVLWVLITEPVRKRENVIELRQLNEDLNAEVVLLRAENTRLLELVEPA